MDANGLSRILFTRIQSLDPESATAVMAYLLLQSDIDQQMLQLAFSSDSLLQAVILKCKQDLGIPFHSSNQLPLHFSLPLSESPTCVGLPGEGLEPTDIQNLQEQTYLTSKQAAIHNQTHSPLFQKLPLCSKRNHQISDRFGFNSPEHKNFLSPIHSARVKLDVDSFNTRSSSSNASTLSVSPESNSASSRKPCFYHARGYCKHGSNCRFLHIHGQSDAMSLMSIHSNQRHTRNEGSMSLEALEKLELELKDLLKGKKAPVSIASLPQLYCERFGRILQAEGYLTESQRHGKVGCSLTKLLERMKKTVTLIDRPHGQHAVVLAEEAHKFLLYREECDDLGAENPGSRQIYLTFPPDSTFFEEDLADYFRDFGPVQKVRIPYQQKRMFGFVTFLYSETVKIILAKGNPHHICGARVLVKPYKEKIKNIERKISEKGEHSRLILNHDFDARECDISPGFKHIDGYELTLRRNLEKHEPILGLEKHWLAEMHVNDIKRKYTEIEIPNWQGPQSHGIPVLNGFYQSDQLRRTRDDLHRLPASTKFGCLFDVVDSDNVQELESKEKRTGNLQSGDNLPDSPFTSLHNQIELEEFSLSEKMMSLSLDRKSIGLASPPGFFECNTELLCSICMGCFVDPIELDCKHMFCLQCILQVIRASKRKCPVCQHHICSQVVNSLAARYLQADHVQSARGAGYPL